MDCICVGQVAFAVFMFSDLTRDPVFVHALKKCKSRYQNDNHSNPRKYPRNSEP